MKKLLITDVRSWGERLEEMAQKGAKMGVDCGKMCHDCAFKTKQENLSGYAEAVDGAFQAIAWDGKFNCHTEHHEDAGKPCAGFLYAKLHLETLK